MAEYERATSPADYGVDNAIDIGHGVQISIAVDRNGNEIAVNTWHNCTHDYTAGIGHVRQRGYSQGVARWPVLDGGAARAADNLTVGALHGLRAAWVHPQRTLGALLMSRSDRDQRGVKPW